jgi:acyl-CoA synthetase (NDP forming)
MGDETVRPARALLHGHGLPMYTFPESLGSTLGALWRMRQWRDALVGEEPLPYSGNRSAAKRILAAYLGKPSIGELDTRPLLESYGIPVPAGRFAATEEAAVVAAEALGGVLALKIVSADVLHKSDAGGIRLNVPGAEGTRVAFREMMAQVQRAQPQACLDGVLVERMAPEGVEVIVGMRRDPSFGPLVMFGLGGIYVELFNDVAFRIAPVSREAARAMIFETRAGRLLSGYRGTPAADIENLIACIHQFSQLCLDFPQIEEAEINPLRVLPVGQGVLALDGRVILGGE